MGTVTYMRAHATTRPPDESEPRAPSDAALVWAARAGEAWAQEALFRRYVTMVDRLAFRLAPDHTEADDIVQDAFAEALERLGRLRDAQAFAGWLRTIVVRTAARRIRRERLRRRLGLVDAVAASEVECVSPGCSAEDALEVRALYRHIDALPAQARVALVLRRVEGRTTPETARDMGVSEGTVKRRVGQAERVLREALGRGGER